MKKFAAVVLFALLSVSFGFAATTGNSTVSASVAQLLSITAPSSVALGTLNPGTATASTGATLNVRSNVRSWKIQAYALLGSLTEYDATEYSENTPVGYNTSEQIPYTLSVNSGTAAAVGTSSETPSTFATFSAKTTGGTGGQTVNFTITAGTEGVTTWQAGNYQDVITFVISAN